MVALRVRFVEPVSCKGKGKGTTQDQRVQWVEAKIAEVLGPARVRRREVPVTNFLGIGTPPKDPNIGYSIIGRNGSPRQ